MPADAGAKIFDGLWLHVASNKTMGLQILRYKVLNHGGKLLERDQGSCFVCCDRSVTEDTQKELMEHFSRNSSRLCGFVLDSKWINECVKTGRLLDMEEFKLLGKIPALSAMAKGAGAPENKGSKWECSKCTLLNHSSATKCEACYAERPSCSNGSVVGDGGSGRSGKRMERDEGEGERDVESKKPRVASIFNMAKSHTQPGDSEHMEDAGVVKWISSDFRPMSKVAAFDMDGTIITTKSGNVHPKDADDWQLLQSGPLVRKLRGLIDDGHCLVLISNQRGIATGKLKIEDLRRKVRAVQAALGMPLAFFAAYKSNEFRKPCPGMWLEVVKECKRRGVTPTRDSSLYVGDAAGRPAGLKRFSGTDKKDFADSDRAFAFNVGLRFHTPEEFFLSISPEPFSFSGIDPSSFLSPSATSRPSYAATHQELALLVGYPGSGKSFFAHQHLVSAGYEWVNRDTLGNMGKCKKACAEALARGKSVVVDNTNPSVEARADFIKLAKAQSLKVRCFWMAATQELSKHLNRVRELAGSDHAPVPTQAYIGYNNRYEEPSTSEGFDAVISVPFEPKFDNPDELRIFKWRM